MKKYVIFGGFDYAVKWKMNQDAIYRGIDYFVENDEDWIGQTYLGKPIYPISQLLKDKDNVFILIGSIIYHTEIEFQLNEMGFEKDKDYMWGIAFPGDTKCGRLWYKTEWNDQKNNISLRACEDGEYSKTRMQIVSKLIDKDVRTVLELGAANERIREFLPATVEYIPCDYIKYTDQTVLCDFTKKEFPHIDTKEKMCVLDISVVSYATDWKWFLSEIAQICDVYICANDDFARINREYRRAHFTKNTVVFNHEIILEMQKLGFTLEEAYDFRLRVVIMKFRKNKSEQME